MNYVAIRKNLLQCDGGGGYDVVSNSRIDKPGPEQNICGSEIPENEVGLFNEPRSLDTPMSRENPPFHPSGQFLRGRFGGANPSKPHVVVSEMI